MTTKKILIFTDSRGLHKAQGSTHEIFSERLAATPGYEVTSYLCPMKWTTTLDFLASFTSEQLANYDHVILYTGIVEWSPRKQSNALEDIYDRQDTENLENFELATQFFSKKVVNTKKSSFDKAFGELSILRHLHSPYSVEYEGEKTINMYPLDLGVSKIARQLVAIPNLIFINANRILSDWNGDYPSERPTNMSVIHDYSRMFAAEFPQNRVVDIFQWSDAEIKTYTCDNIHLTQSGSDWIFDRLIEKLSVPPVAKTPDTAKSKAKVSVVVPVYNVEKWLDDCLTSIATQSLKEIEVILVDDGSTDKSNEICKAFVSKDPRFKYVYQDNRGLGPARNTGMVYASADYVTFIDSDDTVHDDYCKKLFDALKAADADIASCMFRRTDEAGNLKDVQTNFLSKPVILANGDKLSDFEKVLGFYSSSTAHCRIFKKNLLQANNIRFPERLPHEDWFFTYKALMLAQKSVYVEEPLYFWRNRVGSLSNTATALHIEAPLVLIDDTKEMLSRIECSPRTLAVADRRAISSLGIIYGRVTTTAPALVPHLFKRAGDYLDKITEIFRRADRDCVDKEMLRRVGKLIEGASAQKQDAVIEKNAQMLAVRKAYNAATSDREKILSMRNVFAGERCFIIGNGPTLNNHDMELLKDEYTFGVNSLFLKTRDSGFVPTFYVVEDSKVMEENADDIRDYPAPFKFFPEDYKTYNLDSRATCYLKLNWDFYFSSRPYFKIPRFSCAVHDNIFAGQTVTYVNMQLAYYMGFTEVYLIGMDFDYYIPPEHKREGNHILSTTDDPNHFHKDYFGVGKTWKDPRLDRVALSYRQSSLVFEAAERRLANATIGGKLDIFDRVSYDFMLKDPLTGLKRTERIIPPIISTGSERGYLTSSTDQKKPQMASIPEIATNQTTLVPEIAANQSGRALVLNAASRLLIGETGADIITDTLKQALDDLPADDPSVIHFLKVAGLKGVCLVE